MSSDQFLAVGFHGCVTENLPSQNLVYILFLKYIFNLLQEFFKSPIYEGM